MPRTLIPTNTVVRAGIAPVLTAGDDANEMYFVNDGRTFLYVLDTANAVVNLVFVTPGTVDALAIGDRTVQVAVDTTEGMFIGPFPPSIYNQSDGTVHVNLDDDTDVALEAFRLPA